MQARYHFENRNRAFELFWFGWSQKEVRRTGKSTQIFRYYWKRGWIETYDAADFWRYITQ